MYRVWERRGRAWEGRGMGGQKYGRAGAGQGRVMILMRSLTFFYLQRTKKLKYGNKPTIIQTNNLTVLTRIAADTHTHTNKHTAHAHAGSRAVTFALWFRNTLATSRLRRRSPSPTTCRCCTTLPWRSSTRSSPYRAETYVFFVSFSFFTRDTPHAARHGTAFFTRTDRTLGVIPCWVLLCLFVCLFVCCL